MNGKLTLSALEPEDLELLYTIENDVEQWCVSDTNAPYSRYALSSYIANQQYDIFSDKQVRFVVRVDGMAVGLIDLFNFSPANRRAEMGLAILCEHQGQGYATKAIELLKDYCRNTVTLHQVYCVVPADNASSLAMLRKTGFANETLLHDWLHCAAGWKDAVWLTCML